MNISVGVIYSKIETDNTLLLSKLIELYSFTDPKSYYIKSRYKKPKKEFISPQGKFLTGLLPLILADLEQINCIPTINYEYSHKNISNFDTSSVGPYNLTPYQVECLELLSKTNRGIIKLPTGAGKTVLIAAIIEKFKDKKCVILVPNKSLVYQIYKELEKCGIKCGLASGNDFIDSNIMVCNIQSVHKLAYLDVSSPDVLIVDECHLFSQGRYTKNALKALKAPIRIGFTATIPKESIAYNSIVGLLGPQITKITTKELIESNFLTECLIQVIPISYSIEIVDRLYGESYINLYNEFIVNNSTRNNVIKLICDKISKGKILILVNRLDHLEVLHSLIPDAIRLQGKDESDIRIQEIEKFTNSKEKKILIGTKILETGINIPEITHFINARGLKSDISTIQALGRALRKHESKPKVYIFDFLDELKVLETHSRKRINIYKKENHKVEILPKLIYGK